MKNYLPFRLLLLLPFLFPYLAFAQQYDNFWLLNNKIGYDIGKGKSKLDFSGDTLKTTGFPGGEIGLTTCGTTLSDADGNLLFYSNGFQIANKNGELLSNGDSMNLSVPDLWRRQHGSNIPQAVIALPSISDPDEYYLVHINNVDNNTPYFRGTHLLYSKINMSADGGLGAVVEKNAIILEDSIQGNGLSAVRHANGRDWWFIIFRAGSKQYYRILMKPNGFHVMGTGEIDIKIPPINGPGCFSPDGSKFGIAYWENWNDSGSSGNIPRVEIFDFDRCSGLLSNRKRIYYKELGSNNGGQLLGSITFSPNSKFAYISRLTHVHQVDLTSFDWQASLNKVAEYDGYLYYSWPVGFGYGQIAPDGRIYINDGVFISDTYSFIEQPNEPKLQSKVRQRGFQLPGAHGWHIPNHPNYRLGPLEGSGCDTLGIEKTISILANPYPYEACEGGEAHFEVTAFGTGRSYQWQSSSDGGSTWQNLSDGGHFSQTTTEYLLLHDIPASFDEWQFRCIVTGNVSTETSRPATLTLIAQLPVATFDYTQDKDSLHFQNLASGYDYFEWKFSDGDSTLLENPSHLYRKAGSFPALLIATNACGQDTFTQNIVIPELVAEFHADRTHGCAPFTVKYTSDVPYRVSNQKYLTPGSSIPVAWANNGKHTVTYNSPGTFDATLMAFTPQALEKDTLAKPGYITIETGINPTADISAQQTGSSVQLGSGFNFADTYTWFVSNGDTLSGQNVDYVFGNDGIYQVVLQTANHCGAALDTVTFVVGDPGASFTHSPTAGCGPLYVQFQNTSPFVADSVLWLFPNSVIPVAGYPDPSIPYSTAGTYTATMIAWIAGMADTVTQQFEVEIWQDECPMPQIFTQVNGLEVTAWTDCAGSPSFQWSTGDGAVFSSQGITYQYDSAGVYNISLTVTGQCGGSATATTPVTVTGTSTTGGAAPPTGPFTVFPNPAGGQVFFASQTPLPGAYAIKLYTATGVVVAEQKKEQWGGSASLGLGHVPAGLYFYSIEVDGQAVQQGKLVVGR